MEPSLEDALAKIRSDLAWRGPSGSKMGNIVLKRELAEAIDKYFADTDAAREAMRTGEI